MAVPSDSEAEGYESPEEIHMGNRRYPRFERQMREDFVAAIGKLESDLRKERTRAYTYFALFMIVLAVSIFVVNLLQEEMRLAAGNCTFEEKIKEKYYDITCKLKMRNF